RPPVEIRQPSRRLGDVLRHPRREGRHPPRRRLQDGARGPGAKEEARPRVPRPCPSGRRLTAKGLPVQMSAIPFGTTDWSQVERTEHKGERGVAYWRTRHFGAIRVRMVEYTPGYMADHWCVKGHILLCTDGELHTELKDGRKFTLKPGMSYQVADDAEPHRSHTAVGARLFIVD